MYASRRTAVCLPKTSEQARSALGSIRRVILQAKRLWQREDNAVLYRLTQVFSYKSGVARAYRRWFLVKRPAESSGLVNDEPRENLQRSGQPNKARRVIQKGCPYCGSRHHRRSRRRFMERLLHRPPMARCVACSHRFSLPR